MRLLILIPAFATCLSPVLSQTTGFCNATGTGVPGNILSDESDPDSPEARINGIELISVNSGGTTLPGGVLSSAKTQWNGCGGPNIPIISQSLPAPKITITILFEDGSPPENRLGIFGIDVVYGYTITLFSRNHSGETISEADLKAILAHEIGHALGLGHTDSGLMSPTFPLGTANPPTVGGNECSCAEDIWEDLPCPDCRVVWHCL